MELLLAGALSGIISKTCVAPLERLKILKQCDSGNFNNIKTTGYRSLWNGGMMHCIHSVSNLSIQFLLFNKLTSINDNPFINGGISGAVSTAICYPLDYRRTMLTLGQYPKFSYKGFGFSVLTGSLYYAMNFGLYNEWLTRVGNSHTGNIITSVVTGSVTGIVLYPLDVIRHNLQLGQQLPKNLYQGLGLSVIKTSLSVSITLNAFYLINSKK